MTDPLRERLAGKRVDETGASGAASGRARGHGALMDGVYRRQRHIYDATRKYFLLGRDRLIESLSAEPGQTVLEVGCGTGRNLILAARRYPEARFYGFDISEEMLATAREKVARAGLSNRIVLTQGDASAFTPGALFGLPAVDRAFCSYTLSMIPDWQGAVNASLAALGPQGQLHVVDFGQCEGLPGSARAALFRWLAAFHVSPRDDLLGYLETAADQAGRACSVTPLYRGYAWAGLVE